MTDNSKLYSLLDVTEPTPFAPRKRGPTRAMLLVAAASQTVGCYGLPGERWDAGITDYGFDDGVEETDAGIDAGSDAGSDDAGVDAGREDAGSDAGPEDAGSDAAAG